MTLLFQDRVLPWMLECFGAAASMDRAERNHRFIEEALELVQSLGCTASEAHQLVDYVFGRPAGEPKQEIGGVMVTLAALCIAADECMHDAGEVELARIWQKIEQIRAKQAAKPKHSPLPGPTVDTRQSADVARMFDWMRRQAGGRDLAFILVDTLGGKLRGGAALFAAADMVVEMRDGGASIRKCREPATPAACPHKPCPSPFVCKGGCAFQKGAA